MRGALNIIGACKRKRTTGLQKQESMIEHRMQPTFHGEKRSFAWLLRFTGYRKNARELALVLAWLILGMSLASAQNAVCSGGYGQFQSTFETGITVAVHAVRSGGFATKSCEAVLSWAEHRTSAVPSAGQIDIDVLGADLGFGVPVIALDVRETENDSRSSYEIWTLEKQPRLLATLTGGDSYRAVDADLNGYVAIWTSDASAVEAFDGLTYADYSSPPTVVLRFEHGKLVDVSAWYRAQYDAHIKELRGTLMPAQLAEFKKSDGRLAFGSVPASSWVQLRKTKAAVLEIVWAYLYSGRPDQAWTELQAAWAPSDVARIKSAVIAARAAGIDSQVKTVTSFKLPAKWNNTSFVYAYRKPASGSEEKEVAEAPPVSPGGALNMARPEKLGDENEPREIAVDAGPRPISLWRPAPPEQEIGQVMQSNETIELTVDEAGKVWSARMISPKTDPSLVSAAAGWKLIPALKDGKPVAYLSKMAVNPYR
jgi:hypothetical protein